MTNLINIQNEEGDLVVSSREIARNFGKEHFNVVRDIENLTENEPLKNEESKYFIPGTFNHRGNEYKEFSLTRDGFTLLAMGFTGKKALEWKLKYIEAFNKMEKALQEVYHISETAIMNNLTNHLEERLLPVIDKRLEKYEENYRPTHANKISINNYIKSGLGDLREDGEVDLVKDRVLLLLDGNKWQDIPYEKLINNFHLIDKSIRAVKSFRSKKQVSMFEED